MKDRDDMPPKDPCRFYNHGYRNRMRVRYRVLSHYSEGVPTCACCGEATFQFLALDHIGGGGLKERRSLGLRSSTQLYRYLENEGFPPGYRVLCHNCNLAMGFYGYCPHTDMVHNEEWLAEILTIRQYQPHAKHVTGFDSPSPLGRTTRE
jgi:hypothetical protein